MHHDNITNHTGSLVSTMTAEGKKYNERMNIKHENKGNDEDDNKVKFSRDRS